VIFEKGDVEKADNSLFRIKPNKGKIVVKGMNKYY
jgi:hypothetical protein